ncbi:hypothetical protein [Streptomyces sp. NPDC002676]
MLTGKLHAGRTLVDELPCQRRMLTGISNKRLDHTIPLINELRTIAEAHHATVGQVALAWLITYYGDTAVATPGASKYSSRRSLCALVLGLSATGGNSGGLSARSG